MQKKRIFFVLRTYKKNDKKRMEIKGEIEKGGSATMKTYCEATREKEEKKRTVGKPSKSHSIRRQHTDAKPLLCKTEQLPGGEQKRTPQRESN